MPTSGGMTVWHCPKATDDGYQSKGARGLGLTGMATAVVITLPLARRLLAARQRLSVPLGNAARLVNKRNALGLEVIADTIALSKVLGLAGRLSLRE